MSEWTQGVSSNDMAWSCYGNGDKVALFIPGGPGNPIPAVGWRGRQSIKPLLPLLEHGYRIITVARRCGMPEGHTVSDMADDYAEMIRAEHSGQVDLIVGASYGGMIAQFIAANHADCFQHIVVHVAACDLVDPGGIDQQFAQALADGRRYAAGAIMSRMLFPQTRYPRLLEVIFGLMTFFSAGAEHAHFANDVVVEAQAERSFDTREVLPRIRVPVLLVGGDKDHYFPEELMRETAELIPDCTLRLYEGKGHLGAAVDERLVGDILAFIDRAASPP